MKRPQPDLNERLKNTFVSKVGANRKLKRLWGTTVVNGVEVLHARRHYHKASARPANYEKLFKFLKVYSDIKDYDGEGVKSAWFTLNKSSWSESRSVSPSFISDNLNSMWWDPNEGDMPENLTLTTTIVVSENFNNSGSVTGIDWEGTKEEISEYVVTNYESLWMNKKIVQEGVGVINKGSVLDESTNIQIQDEDDLSPDDPWMAILSRYALRSSGVPCTIKDVEVGLGNTNTSGSLYNTIVITLEIPYKSFSTGDSVVQSIMKDLTGSVSTFETVNRGRYRKNPFSGFMLSNESITSSLAKQINYYETVDDIDSETVSRSYIQWEDAALEGLYEDLWTNDGDKWYLRADAIDNPKAYGITHVELNTYIFSLLDTGYKKKKVSIWKKIVAIVVFIVAVVVAFVYPPLSGVSNAVIAAAAAVLTGALVVSLVTLAFSAAGMNEWAMAFASVSKDIEPLVAIAAVVLVVASFVQNGVIEALKNYAGKELDDFVFEELLGQFGDLGKIVADAMDGKLEGSTLDTINKVAAAYSNIQIKKIENIANRNKDLKAEYEKLVEENSMDSDVMMGYMNVYARPATSDWSIYASTFDLPYERGGGALAMGNIQRTTRQATRKTDYDEPMFDSLNFI